MKVIQGSTIDQQLISIDTALARISAKVSTKVIGVIPPIPIFMSLDTIPDTGIIFQMLSPLNGVIGNYAITIDSYSILNTEVTFSIKVQGSEYNSTNTISTKKNNISGTINAPITIGESLIITVDNPSTIKGIKLAYSFKVNTGDLDRKSFLIDEFNTLMGITDEGTNS